MSNINPDKMLKLDALFCSARDGKKRVWHIQAFEAVGASVILVSYGYIGHSLSTRRKIIDCGKNLGKANETTPFEQACLEIRSSWNKKLDKGYHRQGELAEDLMLPMLAETYVHKQTVLKYPISAQFKLNGVRCTIKRLSENNFLCRSRTSKQFFGLSHITNDLKDFMAIGETWDGELYAHGYLLEDILSCVTSGRADSGHPVPLQYWVYDRVVYATTFTDRIQELYRRIRSAYGAQHILLVSTKTLMSEKDLMEFHEGAVQDGYEGSIIRNPNGPYVDKYRSKDVLKFKDFQTEEFLVVGGREGDGGQCVLRCVTSNDQTFDVRCKGSDESRVKQYQELESLVGRYLTVQFQSYSKVGKPTCPVGIGLRPMEFVDGVLVPSV